VAEAAEAAEVAVPWLAAAGAALWVGLAAAVGKLPVIDVAAGAVVAVAATTTGADVGALVAVGPHAASTRHSPEVTIAIFTDG